VRFRIGSAAYLRPRPLRKSAIVSKTGELAAQPHQLGVPPNLSLQPPARLHQVEVAVEVRRPVAAAARSGWKLTAMPNLEQLAGLVSAKWRSDAGREFRRRSVMWEN